MLGRLFKYDMRSLSRFLLIIHGFVILAALICRILFTGRIELTDASIDQNSVSLTLIFIVFFLIIMAVSFGTYIVIAVRFYKNMFSDEGYLTKTLPVTCSQHLISKIIAGSIWAIIDGIVLLASAALVMVTPSVINIYAEHKDVIFAEFGLNRPGAMTSYIAVMVLLSLLGAVSSVIMIYCSIAFGQLFSSHRILGAVVSYFVITMLLSVLATMLMVISGFFTIYGPGVSSANFDFLAYIMSIYKTSLLLCVGTLIAGYIATYYIMKKKINLN